MIDLRLGDCLDVMPTLVAQSYDAIVADIPYGTTACKWDTVIPFAPMWENLKRLAKPKAAIVLFGSQPFTSALVMSNAEMFKYCWVWEKTRAANFMNAKNKPMGLHEDIAVFSHGTCANGNDNRMTYYPQGIREVNRLHRRPSLYESEHNFKRPSHSLEYITTHTGFPSSIIRIPNPNNEIDHPTQKPVALMEYLIRTYTNEGDAVLDFTMGSGTTMVACVNTNRNGTGIEKDPQYFAIAQRRIQEAQAQLAMPMVTLCPS